MADFTFQDTSDFVWTDTEDWIWVDALSDQTLSLANVTMTQSKLANVILVS